jgi:uncharacterized protein (DUF58 family)
MADHATDTTGVWVTLDELTRLQFQARDFTFLPKQPLHSVLAGRHTSRMRGRGLDFEELRGYLPGDDPRTIDWKVTARTGKPHVRVYTEERDRPALIVVDQRIAMFFGTRVAMKSVVAAQVAALAAWRVVSVGDRVGGVIFNDTRVDQVKPHRSGQTVLQFLHHLVEHNTALKADDPVQPNPEALNDALEGVARVARHDYLIVVISDFDGADDRTTRLVTRMSQHNDVIAVPVYDPSSQDLPTGGRLVVGDGALQIEVDLGKASSRRSVLEYTSGRLDAVLRWREQIGVPVLPLSTAEPVVDQVRMLLGQAATRR